MGDAGQKIVIVDDEQDILELLTFDFESAGFEVSCANNGIQALELIQKIRPHLVFRDLRMPHGGVIDLFNSILKIESTLRPKMMFITGYPVISVMEAFDRGIGGFVNKPFVRRELISYAGRILAPVPGRWRQAFSKPDKIKKFYRVVEPSSQVELVIKGKVSLNLIYWVVIVSSLVVAVLSYYWFVYTIHHISTENAYVDTDMFPINSRIMGYVKDVLVSKGKEISQGQTLAMLDDADFSVELLYKEARFKKAMADLQRGRTLIRSDAISKSDLETAEANVASLKGDQDSTLLKMKYTHVLSPVDGFIGKRSVQPGQSLFIAVPKELVWIKANFKETQVEKIKVGDSASIRVDAYPGVLWNGKVESILLSSGAKMSFEDWVAILGTSLGAFMVILDPQITNASLGEIQGALGLDMSEGGWISTAFLIASVLCGCGWNLTSMVVFRVLQGLSGGILIPMAFQAMKFVLMLVSRDSLIEAFSDIFAMMSVGLVVCIVLLFFLKKTDLNPVRTGNGVH